MIQWVQDGQEIPSTKMTMSRFIRLNNSEHKREFGLTGMTREYTNDEFGVLRYEHP